jgi:hypothetical protein
MKPVYSGRPASAWWIAFWGTATSQSNSYAQQNFDSIRQNLARKLEIPCLPPKTK